MAQPSSSTAVIQPLAETSSSATVIQPLPVYSIDEEREWVTSNDFTGLNEHQHPEGRQARCIRLYNICDVKETYKEFGCDSIKAFAEYLDATHKTASATTGYSEANLRLYRSEGKIYEYLHLAGWLYKDMPQKTSYGVALCRELEKKGDAVIDIWKTAIRLAGGSAGHATKHHILEASISVGLTQNDGVAKAAVDEIKKLKDDMKKQKANAEKKRKKDLEALEKKKQDEIVALNKKLDESNKRALPDDIREELEEARLWKKIIYGRRLGYHWNIEAQKYIKVSEYDLQTAKTSSKNIFKREHERLEEPIDISDNVFDFFAEEFAPYYQCHIGIDGLYAPDVFPAISDEEACRKFIGEENILDVDEDVVE